MLTRLVPIDVWGPTELARDRSIPAEPSRRFDCPEVGEIELADSSERRSGRRVLERVGQRFEPGFVFGLQRDQLGHDVAPPSGPAAMVGRAAGTSGGATSGAGSTAGSAGPGGGRAGWAR